MGEKKIVKLEYGMERNKPVLYQRVIPSFSLHFSSV